MNYISFTKDMIADAGALLAQRHTRNRVAIPALPPRFEDKRVATRVIETVLAKPTASGFAALHNGRLVAYLLGDAVVQYWGRSGYVYLPGYALAEDARPAVLQDLYALLGEEWNQKGCFNHYAYISTADRAVIDAFFDLSFGNERIEAVLDLRTAALPNVEPPPGIEIRRVVKGDNDHLAALSDTIWRQQLKAPRWHPMPPEEMAKQAPGWAEIADTPTDMAYLAFENGHAIASLAFYLQEEQDADMTIPPRCREMSAAGTKESARGRGIMTALTWYGLHQVRDNGDEYCQTNWQSANLLAARFWPRFGFKPIAFRLARLINPMIAWAKR